ncbi:hypothetical protein PIB30_103013 [Stylosanthes scabra]|uniref:Uncharacterized protein n=1 Tax=Stylosanthes scabra TaxID=79078 RepID=A0ABU6V0F4_9FABA|nr:hypothetical protein [Stylosanthes scabra]
MKPFKYPPFPNAQFGIADRLPDPVKGILSRDYITNPLAPHLCGVTSSPYEWCRETHHPISGFTKIEKYPPAAKSIAIKGTASKPIKPAEDWVSDSERSPKKQNYRRRKEGVVEPSLQAQRPLHPENRTLSSIHLTLKVLLLKWPTRHSLKKRDVDYFPIKESAIDEEGPFVVPTPEAGDMDFADDEFNLDSIHSEAQEFFLTVVPVTSSGKVEAEIPSNDEQNRVPTQSLPEQSTVDRGTIIEKLNKVLGCLNHSLEEIVASAEIKAQLLEATTYLSQHASSEASSLESFMEDLYNSNILLESSSADLRAAKDDLSKYKKDMAKYGAALLKVQPLVETGSIKEQEARSLEETQ